MPRFAYALFNASSPRLGTCECRALPAGGTPPWLNRRLLTSKSVEPDSDCRPVVVLHLIAPPTSPSVMRADTWGVSPCALLVRANPVSAGKVRAPIRYDVLIP